MNAIAKEITRHMNPALAVLGNEAALCRYSVEMGATRCIVIVPQITEPDETSSFLRIDRRTNRFNDINHIFTVC